MGEKLKIDRLQEETINQKHCRTKVSPDIQKGQTVDPGRYTGKVDTMAIPISFDKI